MTYKEKLRMEDPRAVDEDYTGGCCGCPSSYGYCTPGENLCIIRDSYIGDKICTECWNREIPENTESKVQSLIGEFISRLGDLNVSFDMTYIDDLGNGVCINGRRKENEKDNK